MRILDILGMAFSAIARNKVRSFLTALGVIIGVGSVIAMVHLGQSASKQVTDSISSLGTNLLTVSPAFSRRGAGGVRVVHPSFTAEDLVAIEQDLTDVMVAPIVETSDSLVYANVNHSGSVMGTTNDYFTIRNWGLTKGRFFDDEELASSSTVCILGHSAAQTMFGPSEPLDKTLRVGRISCLVIGVLESKGASMGRDLDDVVIMPVGTVQSRLVGSLDIRSIYVSVLRDDARERTKSELESLLRDRRGDKGEDSFRVFDMQEFTDSMEESSRALTLLLGAIAAISLLVGGIGIMNIMLVSVTERTREIGIRIAIGARVRDVLIQFLVESIVISCMAGLMGVILGIGGTYLATSKMGMPFILSTDTMILGFGFSVIIGVVFGFFPARKAARLNPIEALRHE